MNNRTEPLRAFLSLYRPLLIAFPVLIVFNAVFYFLALRNSFDFAIGHFDASFLFYAFSAGMLLSVGVSAFSGIRAKKTVSLTALPPVNFLTLFASVFTAVMAIVVLLLDAQALTPLSTTLDKAGLICLPFLAAAMLLCQWSRTRATAIHTIACIPAVLSVNLHMFSCYFDASVPLNSPVRNVTTIMSAAVLLFLLSETRLSFGTDTHRVTAPYYIFANGFAAAAAGGFSLGALAYRLFCPTSGDPNLELYRLAMYIGIALLALSRLFALPKIAGEYTEPPKTEKDKKEKKTNKEI